MITKLDTSKLDAKNKGLPFRSELEEFVDDVALAKPKAKFSIDNDCISSDYRVNPTTNQYDRIECVYRVKVYEGGEQIGALSTLEEYRNGSKVTTYGVESFRISKERGRADTTTTMHKKVAIRNAKKFMVARDNSELVSQIGNNVRHEIWGLCNAAKNGVIWAVSQSDIAFAYALAAYQARLSGSGTVTLPANDATLVRNSKNCDEQVARYYDFKTLTDFIDDKKGYAVQQYIDGSYTVVAYANDEVTKYQHFNDIPQAISEKLAMFKVIDHSEPYPHLGMRIKNINMFYIVDGKTKTEQ